MNAMSDDVDASHRASESKTRPQNGQNGKKKEVDQVLNRTNGNEEAAPLYDSRYSKKRMSSVKSENADLIDVRSTNVHFNRLAVKEMMNNQQ